MKTVILDGHTMNPGDMSWEPISAFSEIEVYDRTAPKDVVKRIGCAEAVLTNKVVLDAEVLEQCPSVRYIGVTATGYNIVDIDYCREHGIVVTNVPAYATESVAQTVFAHLLELCMRVGEHSQAVHNGDWCRSADFSFWNYPILSLSGKTMCVVGAGRIGRQVIHLAQAFGMRTVVVPRDPSTTPEVEGAPFVTLEEGFRGADAVSLCAPLTEQTKHMVNAETLAWLKPTAYLINTARGPLVEEKAVADALRAGTLAGYGADVISVEPMRWDNPLLGAPNCTLTPHFAWATDEPRKRLMEITIDNLKAFCDGHPVNTVC